METKKGASDLRTNRYPDCNPLTKLSFRWLNEIMDIGKKKKMTEDDLYNVLPQDSSSYICHKLESNWNAELLKNAKDSKYKPSLRKAMLRTFGARMMLWGFLIITQELIFAAQPFFIMRIVRYFESPETNDVKQAYISAGIFTFIVFICPLFYHFYQFVLARIGWNMKTSTCTLMYKKVLRLSQKSIGSTTLGQIINLSSTDVQRFEIFVFAFHYMIVAPLELFIGAYILYCEVGWGMVAIFYLFLTMILQGALGKVLGYLRRKTAKITDSRIRLMGEILTGMRIIKMYAWEKPFSSLIAKIRGQEMKRIMQVYTIRVFNFTNFETSKYLMTFFTFLVFVSLGGEIQSAKVFLCIGIYGLLQFICGCLFPMSIQSTSETLVTISRIEQFLLLDEKKTSHILPLKDEKNKLDILMQDITANWSEELEEQNTLSNINLEVNKGTLVALIGPVGAGKSSLLNCLLGEISPLKGELRMNKSMAYAPQLAWILAGTLRENILFNEKYDESWYNEVIEACNLKKDIESFQDGDMTLLGERGITLSGGQKARLSLARAVYKRNSTDLFLLDDPLSAVDASVGKHLFEKCICGILKNKTRILVTHQLQYLENADKIIIMKEGSIVKTGTFTELTNLGADFALLLKPNTINYDDGKISPDIRFDDNVPLLTTQQSVGNQSILSRTRTISTNSQQTLLRSNELLEDEIMFTSNPHLNKEITKQNHSNNEMGHEEDMEEGKVSNSVYFQYFNNGLNIFMMVMYILLLITNQVLQFMCDWWLAKWALDYNLFTSESPASINPKGTNQSTSFYFTTIGDPMVTNPMTTSVEQFDHGFYLRWYTVFVFTTIVAMIVWCSMHFIGSIQSSINLHNEMFKSIVSTGIRFFDVNPTGRILNRFSKDMGYLDENLPNSLIDFVYLTGVVLRIVLVVSCINYFVIIIVVPIFIYFLWLRQHFMQSSRKVARLNGTTRSPVISLLSATIDGLTTIRAFKSTTQFLELYYRNMDVHGSAQWLHISFPRWLAFRLDLTAAVFIAFATFGIIFLSDFLKINPTMAGLTLTYCASMMGLLQWTVRQSAEVENFMTSTERILKYSELLPEETNEEKVLLSDDWPNYGIISFINATYSHYDGGPPVLNNLRFNIRANEKVGIVGRTGAGKSSLISSLFRMNNLSNGEIMIDGIDTKTLSLHDLRSSLSIIPQEPMLFTGTFRQNLDPFSMYEDVELWTAVDQVQLRSLIESFPLKLEGEIQESGSNLSVGQRQLLCLARALLKKNKILVIDEATANVDLRTDHLIQQTLRENFGDCTVLTIAHRLHTIMDSDRVLVLDAGKMKEFDPPYVLLKKEEGFFYDMVKNTGEKEAKSLRNIAKKAYEKYMSTQYEKRE